MVSTEMNFSKNSLQVSYWKVNSKCLEYEILRKEIVEEIRTVTDLESWNYCKCKIQSLIRARWPLKVPKSNIQRLSRKINILEKKIARDQNLSNLQIVIENLKKSLQNELQNLADKWQSRHNTAAIDKIKIPNNARTSSSIEVLHYIKEYYSHMYQSEPIKAEAVNRITEGLPQ
ncbi:5017_t:CDS:2, partial [Gigaspora rosea]